ncbi:MAG: transcription-repair coupling factor [Firmicutes bacterium]|nr:transcription-repair coupling factor [Bacillota bacterium]
MSEQHNKEGLFLPIKEEAFIRQSIDHIRLKEPFLLTGAQDSVQNHLQASLAFFTGRPSVIITPNDLRAKEVLDEMRFYNPFGTYYLPAKDLLFYSADVKSLTVEQERMQVFRALREGKVRTLVMSIEALMDPLIPKQVWEDAIIRRRIGEDLPLEELSASLALMGYERSDQVEAPGQFAVRGGIVDIYPISVGAQNGADPEHALRIELWGDEIDSIRVLDVASQRSLERLEYVTIYPVSEVLVNAASLDAGLEKIRAELKSQEKALRDQSLNEEADRLKGGVEKFISRFLTGRTRGLETYISFFFNEKSSILDYIPADSVLYFQEPVRIRERFRVLEDELNASLDGRLRGGYLLPTQMNIFPTFERVQKMIEPFSRVFLCSLPSSGQEAFHLQDILRVNAHSMNVLSSEPGMLLDEIKADLKLGYRTVLLYDSTLRCERAVTALGQEDVPCYLYEDFSQSPKEGSAAVGRGLLNKGFAYPDARFSLVSMKEISERRSGRGPRRKRKFKAGERIESFSDLTVGDYVVHENHGVGIYQGIVQMDDENTRRDYFKILYKEGGVLYVPTTSLDMLQKYLAQEEAKPKLNRLGGGDWQRTKAKVKESVKQLAEDLLKLYAERQAREGFAFSKDSLWQREFEEAFPFEETDDQMTAIEDTKKDMESHHIMDRLICGDVGYGKTEVAIRAAFKAAQDSKQVAVLAPTTILAQQHFNTFTQRMQDYPVSVGLLSRFRTAKEQKQTLEDLKNGKLDIVIGTHRLLSKDVQFKNLGLLVVDEEQRFGVSHKEKIKALKTDVDVLTLTATPIPRTLHMSLSGMRDMSLLEEAPMHRIPVQTFVMEDDEQMVKEAIYRELARGGQVFFLYNRVENIERVASKIASLVPEARLEIAHGQMDERQLEQIMLRFVEGDIDVLVCTTIIETGLDIPNANTLIVLDADTMGLSQLYQLRGRVGRSTRLAYAYFLYRKGKVLPEAAEKRLTAISEFTDFGSGFKIAMRDLQIRGAGNVLGPEQHGHMGAVGYDLYCKLLKEAMDQIKHVPVQESFETTVLIKVDAYIPASYIKGERQKLEAYKKIAQIRTVEDFRDMFDELFDRYGDMPSCVSNLLHVSYIKAMASYVGCEMIEYQKGQLILQLRQDSLIDFDALQAFLKEKNGEARIVSQAGKAKLLLRVEDSPKDDVLLSRIMKIMEQVKKLHVDEVESA